MKFFIFGIFSIVFCFSCTKESTTNSHSYIVNKTTHKIKINPYFNGVIPSEKAIILLGNDTVEIANESSRGINGNSGFYSSNFAGSDSVIVIFDDTYYITHYSIAPMNYSNKYYLYSSNRNILNKNSFIYSSQDISGHQRENFYYYNFIEQDYLDTQ